MFLSSFSRGKVLLTYIWKSLEWKTLLSAWGWCETLLSAQTPSWNKMTHWSIAHIKERQTFLSDKCFIWSGCLFSIWPMPKLPVLFYWALKIVLLGYKACHNSSSKAIIFILPHMAPIFFINLPSVKMYTLNCLIRGSSGVLRFYICSSAVICHENCNPALIYLMLL